VNNIFDISYSKNVEDKSKEKKKLFMIIEIMIPPLMPHHHTMPPYLENLKMKKYLV
jgi:hypothetical protein